MKYLKLKHSLLLFAVFLLAITSCDDLVDEDPISQIGAENFWLNNNDAEAGVSGIYDAFQKTYNNKHYLWGEFRSDNFSQGSESASGDNLELVFNTLSAGNAGTTRWNNFYNIISSANLAIKYIPQITGANQELLGEAYALRAYAYFDAVRVWGAAPLFTEPIESLEQELERTKTDGTIILNEVVIPDMLEAERLIESPANNYRFSKNSVWAFQASVYMWLKDYAKAKAALDKIVASGEYSLVDTPAAWQNLFLNDIGDEGPGKIQEGPELIMSINYDINDSDRSGIYALFFAGLPSYYLSPTLEAKWIEKFPVDQEGWEAKYPDTDPVLSIIDENGDRQFIYGDWRLYFSREDGIDGTFEELGTERLAKYNKQNYSPTLDDSDIVLFRYAGVLLMLAEAENQLGNDTRALELVNEIRTARQLPLVDAAEFGATVAERENYILDERQLELLGEGKRWWDLRRTDKVLEVMNPILSTVPGASIHNPQTLLFPIFNEHLIDNPRLEQTPGY